MLFLSGVCQGAICVFCAVKLNVQNGCRKHTKIAEELIMRPKVYKKTSNYQLWS